jgi:hypothetical protein
LRLTLSVSHDSLFPVKHITAETFVQMTAVPEVFWS